MGCYSPITKFGYHILESTLLERRVCLKEDSVDFTEPNVTVLSITSPLPNAVIQSSNKSNHNPAIRLNVYSRNFNMSLDLPDINCKLSSESHRGYSLRLVILTL